MDSRIYWIWLAQSLGPAEPSMGELLDHFGNAAVIYNATEQALRDIGISARVVRRLQDKSLTDARTILNRVVQSGDWLLTPEDALYPVNLRRLSDLPAVLYCRGTMPDMDACLTIAVVGTRKCSDEGLREAHSLAAGLAAGGAVVVSGGAKGVDAAAHAGALDGGGVTVAVMGCPVDERYPVENAALRARIVESGGLLMSEYPHGLPYRCVYEIRNRLLSGLSHGVCLGETPLRSGGRITARLAREQGREVFAMPASLVGHLNDGAHREIQNGAALITSAADVLEEYHDLFPFALDIEAAREIQKQLHSRMLPKTPATAKLHKKKAVKQSPPASQQAQLFVDCPETASPAARQVYDCLEETPCPVDELAAKTGLSVPTLLAALTELEMLGCAANTAGQKYYRKSERMTG